MAQARWAHPMTRSWQEQATAAGPSPFGPSRTSPLLVPDALSLNAEQTEAVTFTGGHCLVLAGAGTGKTRTIIGRAAALLGSGVPAERVLILAFTRRAAREVRTRLESIYGERAGGVVTGTFHHFCLRTMRRQPEVWGIGGMTVLDRDDSDELWRLARAGEVDKHDKVFPKVKDIAGWYSYARNCDLTFEDYLDRFVDEDDPDAKERIIRIAAAYEARKQQRRYLDFDDILVRFADRLEADDRLRASVASRHDDILVDEFQDTNPVQWRILEALTTSPVEVDTVPHLQVDEQVAGPVTAASTRAMLASITATPAVSRSARLYYVGDDAQSIYMFRGADFETVHSFEQRLPGATVLTLSRNYRSHQEVLDLANWLLDRSVLDYRKHLVAERGPAGEKPVLATLESPAAEGAAIVQDLVRRHDDLGASWRDHMVLLRTAYSGRSIEAALVAAKVPYVLIGGMSLMAAAHVKDLFALLRAALGPHDELAWSRYLHLWPKVGEVTARRTIEAMDAHTGFEAALDAGRALVRQDEPFTVVTGVRARRDAPASALTLAVESLTPLLERHYDRWPQRKSDLDLLVRLAKRHHSLEGFLDTYTLDPVVTERIDEQDEDDRVTLITVHSAKGTEAKVVYVAAATARNYPHLKSRGDRAAVEEERRVLYVAFTRAQDELIVSRAIDGDAGWVTSADAEYFLGDLPADLVHSIELLPRWLRRRP